MRPILLHVLSPLYLYTFSFLINCACICGCFEIKFQLMMPLFHRLFGLPGKCVSLYSLLFFLFNFLLFVWFFISHMTLWCSILQPFWAFHISLLLAFWYPRPFLWATQIGNAYIYRQQSARNTFCCRDRCIIVTTTVCLTPASCSFTCKQEG